LRFARSAATFATCPSTIAAVAVVATALVAGQLMLRAQTVPASPTAMAADALRAVRRRVPVWRLRAQDLATGAVEQARERFAALV